MHFSLLFVLLFANFLIFTRGEEQRVIGGEEPEQRLPYRQYVSEQNYVRNETY